VEQLLRRRMRRRNLLTAPPSYLGYDVPSWNAEGAFEDVVVDCYIFAVASRIEGLRNQLRVHANIDGLIVRNVDNFLLERQSRRDPIGYAVFGNLKAAVGDLVASGEAAIDGLENGALRSASIVRFAPERVSVQPCEHAKLVAAVADAPGWGDALAGLTSITDGGGAWIADFLRHLRATGIFCVRVSDLVSAVASRARVDWAARHAVPAGELAQEGEDGFRQLVRLVWPDESVEVRDLLQMLRRAVPERIAQERQQRVRNGLTAVFEEWFRIIEETGLSRPNQADLAERLGMSDATVSDYLRRLRQIIEPILPENPEG
jgi:hypothetical protein